ncbi:VanW family protein [Wukongibacter baidiensis]|uniref:VanW family protein n=1 Tax=Wukongibacter baidiensis TaxID=1723361 RepID=UPI003D7F7DD1
MATNKNKDTNGSKKKLLYILAIVAALILFCLLSAVVSLALIYKDSIHSGIFIEDIDIGGLSVIEANSRIEGDLLDDLENDKLILKYNGRSWSFNSKDLDIKYDFLKAVNDAYLIGRRGTLMDRAQTMIDLVRRPYSISLKSSVNKEIINKILAEIENEVNRPSLDAKITRENEKFIITKEELGLRLKKDETAAAIEEQLLNSGFYDVVEMDLLIENVTPKYTFEKLNQIQDLMGTYSTKFNTKLWGRSYNVNIASKSIDGTLLMPGEIFSFNNIVGPRTVKNGYKTAPVIFKGELVDGIGGGVCQVSSTLYNTVLMSQLGIVERVNHTIPSTYVPKGFDATVSYGVLDFKFQNTLDIPIYIESITKGNRITINIYGRKATNRTIKLSSNIDKVIKKDTEILFDDTIFEGEKQVEEKGRNGYKVSAYMHIYENGKLLEKKLLSKDYYRPRKEIIKEGTKKRIEDKPEDEEKMSGIDTNN